MVKQKSLNRTNEKQFPKKGNKWIACVYLSVSGYCDYGLPKTATDYYVSETMNHVDLFVVSVKTRRK